jgi:hypothetical protein
MNAAFESVVVAEVVFNRNALPDELRRLGEALEACRQAEGWIAQISGLDALLKGELPQRFSKAVVNLRTGEIKLVELLITPM